MEKYPVVASRHKDCLGNGPRHAFFYPAEEYHEELLTPLAELCRAGFGEVEIHLHHDNDSGEVLRRTLLSYKDALAGKHGLLSVSRLSGEVKYGFIHGNWALDNSRPDGRWCGVNDEITILSETGCYADFTMPSAPSETQTRTINRIYYAIDDPNRPKSHDAGLPAAAGSRVREGLLCIQGPLGLNLESRKFGLLPRIENGALSHDMPLDRSRFQRWIFERIHVKGRPDIVFVKVYAHGCQETAIDFFFRQGMLDRLFSAAEEMCSDGNMYRLYYASPRQMYNVVKGLESKPHGDVRDLLDFELVTLTRSVERSGEVCCCGSACGVPRVNGPGKVVCKVRGIIK